MDVRITIETTFDNGEKRSHQLDSISRPYRVTCPEGFGLRLEDGKKIVGQIQKAYLFDQIEEITRESRVCPTCSRVRAIHDDRTRVLDTLFGRLQVKAARLRRCSCDVRSEAFPARPISPLACFFPDRATPELQRLHAGLGSAKGLASTPERLKQDWRAAQSNNPGWAASFAFFPLTTGVDANAPVPVSDASVSKGAAQISSRRVACAGSKATRRPRTCSRFSRSSVYSGNCGAVAWCVSIKRGQVNLVLGIRRPHGRPPLA